MSSDEKVWVVVELTRDEAETWLSWCTPGTGEQTYRIGHAIRAALARKEEPWVGWSNGNAVTRGRQFEHDHRVLVVQLPEEDAK